jgi:CHAD domain-containing protein
MEDVLELRKRLARELEEEPIHDLRVALRRCRTIAQGMRPNGNAGPWRKLDRRARKLLHALGPLRDSQVLAALVERTAPRGGRLRDRVLTEIRREEKKHDASAASRALREFDVRTWRRLAQRASQDDRLRSMRRDRARRIVLRRWVDAVDAHDFAIRNATPEAWHLARIAWKKLRYTLEAFAPDLHDQWENEIAALQTALGELHDLDSLASFARTHDGKRDRTALKRWLAVIGVNRGSQIAHYKRLTRGPTASWRNWGSTLAHPRAADARDR